MKSERRKENEDEDEDERLNAAEQQVNCDDSLVNVALPRLNAAEQRVNCRGAYTNGELYRH